jgi:peptidoglycan/LPS O-acetylase OafA/YrhL
LPTSGFFVVGLLIYQHYRGRRGIRFWSLFALAIGTAIFQATHKLERLGAHPDSTFDPRVVATICVVALLGVFLATRIKHIPLPATFVLAAGGMTYPLYLLHMQMGYVIFSATEPHDHAAIAVTTIVAGCTSCVGHLAVCGAVDAPICQIQVDPNSPPVSDGLRLGPTRMAFLVVNGRRLIHR